MTRPCPWCLEEQPLVPDVPAAPAGTAAPVSAPSPALPAPPTGPFRAGAAPIFRRLFAREGGEGRRRNNLQGESR